MPESMPTEIERPVTIAARDPRGVEWGVTTQSVSTIVYPSPPPEPTITSSPYRWENTGSIAEPVPVAEDPTPLPWSDSPVRDRKDFYLRSEYNREQINDVRAAVIDCLNWVRQRFVLDYRINVSNPFDRVSLSEAHVETPEFRVMLNVRNEPDHLRPKPKTTAEVESCGGSHRQAAYYYLVKALYPSGKAAKWPVEGERPVDGTELDLLKAARDHLTAEIDARSSTSGGKYGRDVLESVYTAMTGSPIRANTVSAAMTGR